MLSEYAEEEAVKHQESACLRMQRQNSSTVRSFQCGRTDVLSILEKCINTQTGTDGCRVLCHQFSTSSLPHLASSISRSKRCSLMMKHMTLALLQLLVNGDRGQHTQPTVFPLQSGRPYCIVFWSRRNRSERWLLLMVSPKKRSVASFVLRRKCIYSKKSSGPISRDGMSVMFSCSVQERIPRVPNTTAQVPTSLFSYERSSQLLCTPTNKAVGLSGPQPCMWRHVIWPDCHTVSITGENGAHLNIWRIVHGKQMEKPS